MRAVKTPFLLALAFLWLCGCPPKKPKYPLCEGDKDCQAGEKCVNKRCQQCAEDKDCGPGKSCQDGACAPLPGWCSADGDCPPGQVCKENSCRPCAADAECGEGGRCRDGRCLRRGQCDTDEDCAEDEDCRNHVCLKAREALTPGGDAPKCTLKDVYFGFDQYVISEDAKPLLQKNAECLSTTPRSIAVVGMTDPRGTVEYNIGLSDDRAQAVTTYLSRLGIDPARLRKIPKGATEASGSDEAGWAIDRRVSFVWEK